MENLCFRDSMGIRAGGLWGGRFGDEGGWVTGSREINC